MGEVLEEGILSRWKAGERGRKFATMQNISQSKKGYKGEAMETGRYPGRQGTKGGRFVSPQGPICACARITFSWAYKSSDVFVRNQCGERRACPGFKN